MCIRDRVLAALVGENASDDTRTKFRRMLRSGELDEREITLELQEGHASGMPTFDIPGMPGAQMGMINLNEILGKTLGGRMQERKLTVAESYELLIAEESDKLLDDEKLTRADVSREGVQRDLLPLIEGTVVATKHGQVRTDHILFVASGAFHTAKPSDLLPELQGRLPIRVELKSLERQDLIQILTEPENSLPRQYTALMATEEVTLSFTDTGIDAIATLANEINHGVENIGARRLHTVMEKLLEDISFTATDKAGTDLVVDDSFVQANIGDLVSRADLSKFIL